MAISLHKWPAMVSLLVLIPVVDGAHAFSRLQKEEVLACVSQLQSDEDWKRCNNLIQSPCGHEEYGSTGQLSCLKTLHESWSEHLESARKNAMETLAREGRESLNAFAKSWSGIVKNRCSALAEYQQEVSPGTARIQCELSEIVGFSAELAACRRSASDAPFCIMKEQQ